MPVSEVDDAVATLKPGTSEPADIYVGAVGDHNLGLLVGEHVVRGYLCDGSHAQWFLGARDGDHVTLVGDRGGYAQLTIGDDHVEGMLGLDPRAPDGEQTFSLSAADDESGVYTDSISGDGTDYRAAWVALNDGSALGAIRDAESSQDVSVDDVPPEVLERLGLEPTEFAVRSLNAEVPQEDGICLCVIITERSTGQSTQVCVCVTRR